MTVRMRTWLAIVAAAIGLYFVGRWQGAASVADAAAVRNAETTLAAGKAYRQRIAGSLQRQQQYAHNAQTWHRTADSLRTLALHADTIVVPDSGPVTLWRATANAEREGAAQCVLEVASCEERAQAAEIRAAALDSVLGNVLKVASCKILFLRCPSRTAMFLVGTGVGFVGGVWTGKK